MNNFFLRGGGEAIKDKMRIIENKNNNINKNNIKQKTKAKNNNWWKRLLSSF